MSPSTAQRGRGAGRTRAPAQTRSFARSWLLWVVIAVVAVAGIVAIAISAGGGNEAKAGEVADEVTITGSDLPPLPTSGADPAVGDPAPGVEGTSPSGGAATYQPGRGKPSVVFILAHSCPHCQTEVPRIVSLADTGETDGVKVVAITTGTDPNLPNYPPSAWLEREGWPFPVIADTENQEAGLAFGLTGYPFMVFVDADGNVVGRLAGEVPEDTLALLFEELRNGEQLSIPSAGASTPSG